MPGDTGGAIDHGQRRDRVSGMADPAAGKARERTQRQWTGVCGAGGTTMGQTSGDPDQLHSAGKPLGEWPGGKLSRQIKGWLFEPGSIWQFTGSAGADRSMAAGIQRTTSAQFTGVPDTPGIWAAIQLKAAGRYAPLRFEL